MLAALSPAVLVAITGGFAVLLIAISAYLSATAQRARASRRIRTFVEEGESGSQGPQREPFAQRILQPLLARLAGPGLRITPRALVESTREDLALAGQPWGIGALEFVGIRVGLALLGAILGLLAAPLLGRSPIVSLGLPIALAGVGYLLPGVALANAARGRRRRMLRSLPSALELLSISMEAGLGFDAAIAHVAQQWETTLGEEFKRMYLETQMGRPRIQVMQEFQRRTGLPEVEAFVSAVLQSEAMGVPISKLLQDLAHDLRQKARQRAETQARIAPVKMLFPMVLLILPALFIVIIAPAIPRVLSVFGTTLR